MPSLMGHVTSCWTQPLAGFNNKHCWGPCHLLALSLIVILWGGDSHGSQGGLGWWSGWFLGSPWHLVIWSWQLHASLSPKRWWNTIPNYSLGQVVVGTSHQSPALPPVPGTCPLLSWPCTYPPSWPHAHSFPDISKRGLQLICLLCLFVLICDSSLPFRSPKLPNSLTYIIQWQNNGKKQ